MTYFLQILFGALGGFFGGLGMGGGTLLIPLLTIFLDFNQQLSQGINLMSFVLMAIFSLVIHFSGGFVSTKGLGWIIGGGVVSTIFGAILATILPSVVLRKIFGGFLIVLAILELIKAFKAKKGEK